MMTEDPRRDSPAATQRWVPRDGGHYCTAHESAFEIGEDCYQCVDDPGPVIAVTQAATRDAEAMAAEREVQCFARSIKRYSDESLAGTDREQALGLKAADTYLKAMRLWREMHAERMLIDSDERLLAQHRQANGLRGQN